MLLVKGQGGQEVQQQIAHDVAAVDIAAVVVAGDDDQPGAGDMGGDAAGLLLLDEVMLPGGDQGGHGDGTQGLGFDVGLGEHQRHQGVGAALVLGPNLRQKIGLHPLRGQVGAADGESRQGLRVVKGQEKAHDAAVAEAVKAWLIQPQDADKLVHILRHIGVVVLAKGFVGAVAPAVGGVDPVAGGGKLSHLPVEHGVALAVAVDEDDGSPLPCRGVMEGDAVDGHGMECVSHGFAPFGGVLGR